MKAESLSDPSVVEFYSEIIDEGDLEMLPMQQLVDRLAGKEYAESISASTSHYNLCLGPGLQQEESLTISYFPHVKQFQIRYWNANTHKFETHKVYDREAENLIDSLVLRLLIQTREVPEENRNTEK